LVKTGDWRQMADLGIRVVGNPELSIHVSAEGGGYRRELQLAQGWSGKRIVLRIANRRSEIECRRES